MESEEDSFFGGEFVDLCVSEAKTKRELCHKCRRPPSVCWCAYLPQVPLLVKTTLYILQHPFEETRNLKTAPMLTLGLPPDKCIVLKGKRFSKEKYPQLHAIVEQPNTLLVYPTPDSEDIERLRGNENTTADHPSFNLILLDGTWPQALGIYQKNSFLHSCRSVVLTMSDSLKRFYPGDDHEEKDMKSRYVIRTQPTENSLSTVETAALCIAILENRKDVMEAFLKPLEALCRFQLDNGAVSHDCKIEGGVHRKLFKSKQKKLKARIEAMVPS